MELVIRQNSNILTEDFINYLCDMIQIILLNSGIDFTKFQSVFNKDFNNLSINTVLILASKNLLVNNYDSYVVMQINPNIYFPGSLRRLIDLCQILNYGTFDIQGTHIFSDTFDYVAKNINQIYLSYILEM